MLDQYPEAAALDPDEGETLTAELAVTDDVLVKAFALGPGARIEPHEHAGATNVFHVVDGAVTVVRDDEEERVGAPGVVLNERGAVHGAHNDTEEIVVLTASLCPLPGGD
jgi:Cupin domain.